MKALALESLSMMLASSGMWSVVDVDAAAALASASTSYGVDVVEMLANDRTCWLWG